MKKRIAAIFTALMLICTNAYAAPPGVTVVIPPKDNLSDEKYVITVAIAENPGFAAAQIELAYDKDVIECQQIIPGEVLKEMLTDTNPKATGEKQSAILSAAGTENISVSGNIASFVFDKPKDGNPAFEIFKMIMGIFHRAKKKHPTATPPTRPVAAPPAEGASIIWAADR